MGETETAFNPNRQLCPDGACVGLIGDDARCSVCARPEGAGADSEDGATATEAQSAVSGFDPGRRLCDDGSCVGVIGAESNPRHADSESFRHHADLRPRLRS